jgi:hypothetical protein
MMSPTWFTIPAAIAFTAAITVICMVLVGAW